MTQEQDLQRLEQAVSQIPEVEAELRRQEREGRLLVWFPGLVLLALVGIDLHRTSAPLADWIFLMVMSLLMSTFLPFRRKWEIDATRTWLALLEEARRIVAQH